MTISADGKTPNKQLESEQNDNADTPMNLLRVAYAVLSTLVIALAVIAVSCNG